jgi:murein DD-endopeptidase MepM/ murein hydrolase activator NlpD
MTWKRHGATAAVIVALLGTAVACGHAGATGAGSSAYLLPWQAGQHELVLQGNARFDDWQRCTSGCSTHNDDAMRYALDFDLPEGTPVLAARAGTVALANGSWPADHCGGVPAPAAGNTGENSGANAGGKIVSQFIGNEANFVEIAHGDGTSALYLHLSTVSPGIEQKAKSGERVEQGEVLGLSGKTGYTECAPHLHFQVEASVKADWITDSLPVSFTDHDVASRTADGVPVEGESYVSDNVPIGSDGTAS